MCMIYSGCCMTAAAIFSASAENACVCTLIEPSAAKGALLCTINEHEPLSSVYCCGVGIYSLYNTCMTGMIQYTTTARSAPKNSPFLYAALCTTALPHYRTTALPHYRTNALFAQCAAACAGIMPAHAAAFECRKCQRKSIAPREMPHTHIPVASLAGI